MSPPHSRAPGSGIEQASSLQAAEMIWNSLCVETPERLGDSKTGTAQPTNGFHSLQRKTYNYESFHCLQKLITLDKKINRVYFCQ